MIPQERKYEWLKIRKGKLELQIASRQNALDKLRTKLKDIMVEIIEYESVMGKEEKC